MVSIIDNSKSIIFSNRCFPLDPRSPQHRRQAFDLGDAGAGSTANSLSLGCDCLGSIQYFDSYLNDSAGEPVKAPNVICLHEQVMPPNLFDLCLFHGRDSVEKEKGFRHKITSNANSLRITVLDGSTRILEQMLLQSLVHEF